MFEQRTGDAMKLMQYKGVIPPQVRDRLHRDAIQIETDDIILIIHYS